MSLIDNKGKVVPYGSPVSGFIDDGPVEPKVEMNDINQSVELHRKGLYVS